MPQPSRTGNESLAPEDAWRSATYSLLGRLLAAAPNSDLLQRVGLIDADGAGAEGLEGAWADLGREARVADPGALVEEYNALFIGLGRGELVPYASWHRTGFIMDQPLAALRADLRRLGIERSDDVSEPEDHIAALCEVMAVLIDDPDYPVAGEREFFSDHLAPWAGQFFSRLENARSARFYRTVGRLGAEFIELEKQCLTMSA